MKRHGDETAAVIVTPVGHPLAEKVQEPAPGFLEGIRALTERYGSVLVFDEIRSGFRVAMGGAQERYGVVPDLAIFGKAMANGYAVSAVTGNGRQKAAEKEVFHLLDASTPTPSPLWRLSRPSDHGRDVSWTRCGRRETAARSMEKGARWKPIGAELRDSSHGLTSLQEDSATLQRNDDRLLYVPHQEGVFLPPFHHGLCAGVTPRMTPVHAGAFGKREGGRGTIRFRLRVGRPTQYVKEDDIGKMHRDLRVTGAKPPEGESGDPLSPAETLIGRRRVPGRGLGPPAPEDSAGNPTQIRGVT
jgi:hypothetical protein